MHEQDPESKEIWTHQHHYLKQLKPIDEDAYCMAQPEDPVSESMHAAFRSLLGGVAWLTLTMMSICIYVSALQRQSHAPTVKDIRNCNRLLRWINQHNDELGMRYVELVEPLRLVAVSDSAFKAQEFVGLAMRGCIIMLVSATSDLPTTKAWKCAVIDFLLTKTHACGTLDVCCGTPCSDRCSGSGHIGESGHHRALQRSTKGTRFSNIARQCAFVA